MRVTHVVASIESRYGGPSKSVLQTARAQAGEGHSVRLFATDPENAQNRNDGALRIDIFKRAWPGAICPSPSLRKALATEASDAVHCHGLWLRTVAYAKASAQQSGAPFVLAPRGMMGPWAWSHHRLRKWLASTFVHPGAFDAVSGWHATSEEESADIRRLGFRAPICVAPNGVRLPDADQLDASAQTWKKLVPESATRPIALFYSRFHSKKRVAELIRLWADLPDSEWLLLVAGIPEEYGSDTLKSLAASLGCGDRVRIHEGAQLPPPYAIASLFLLPSHNENFGLVIAEAMAFGRPIVVTDTTPWRRASEMGAGWCVPWSDFGRTLSAALRESPERLQRRGAAARQWVAADYGWETSAHTLLSFYKALSR